MSPKRQEHDQLQQYLNKLLNDMPLVEPSSGFTDKVMKGIQASTHVGQLQVEAPASSRSSRRNAADGLAALAATFLFIHSGLLNKIMTIDTQVHQLSAYIEKLFQFLNS